MRKKIGFLVMILTLCMTIQSATGAKPTKDIVDIAGSDPQFSILVTALKAAGLVDTLKGEGPFTVFAPTNDAFSKLPAGTLESLLKPENKEKLIDILTYHVAPGSLDAAAISNLTGKSLKMVNGKSSKIEVKDGKVFIDNAQVTSPDIMTKNGIIHVIDTVILPQ